MLMLETVKHITINYNFGNLTDWISAFATLAAVLVSLYLANRKDRPKIRFAITVEDELVMLNIINLSFRPVYLEMEYGDLKSKVKMKGHAALNPLKSTADIGDLSETVPFAQSESYYRLSASADKSRKVVLAKDIISGVKYKVIGSYKNEQWNVVQYRFAIGNFMIWKRK